MSMLIEGVDMPRGKNMMLIISPEGDVWEMGDLLGNDKLIDGAKAVPAADVLPRDEGIKLGAELAAMHGATPEQQQLEEAYLKGVEYGMTRRDARPVVRGKWIPDYDYTEYDYDGSTPLPEPRKFQDGWQCSLCGGYMPSETNFCPNCGADMREEI